MTSPFTCAALALLVVACGTLKPPSYFSIDSDFSGSERETISAAVGDWCAETGDCPELVFWSERGRFLLVDDLPEDGQTMRDCPNGSQCVVSGNNDGDVIRVARNRPLADSLDRLWQTAAHEWGHFCIVGHLRHGLLAPSSEGMTVDAAASAAWREGCAGE